MNFDTNFNIAQIILDFVVFLFSLCVHEVAHAWTSEKLGDETGRYEGRISMDPTVHVDPLGTIFIPIVNAFFHTPVMGWAKPVPVNPQRWRDHFIGNILVSGAGPASNLVLATLSVLVMKGLFLAGIYPSANLVLIRQHLLDAEGLTDGMFAFLSTMVVVNVSLAVFNMIPVPPLDGSHIMASLLSRISTPLMEQYESFRPYGMFILIAMSVTGLLSYISTPMFNSLLGALYRILR